MWYSTVGGIVMLILSLLVTPPVAQAQPLSRVPRIGVQGDGSPTAPSLAAFRQGLRELGYIEGQNIVIAYRYANSVVDQIPTHVAELLDLNVDVLVVGGTAATQAAKARTSTVPIVFTLSADPVGMGLVASLAHPGGNATGLSNLVRALSGKQLELLKTAVPQVARVAVLNNPASPDPRCPETHYPSARMLCFVPPSFWRRHPLATCADCMATAWGRPPRAAPNTACGASAVCTTRAGSATCMLCDRAT